MRRTVNSVRQNRTWATWLALAGVALAVPAQVLGQQAQPEPGRRIVVSVPERKLAVLEGEHVLREFEIAVGATESPSPTGEFRVVNRLENPTYYKPGVVMPPGEFNPLGPRWIGLSKKSFGIHGTNEPESIGQAASHGCIRMRNDEVKELFEMVRVGDVVEIRGEAAEGTPGGR